MNFVTESIWWSKALFVVQIKPHCVVHCMDCSRTRVPFRRNNTSLSLSLWSIGGRIYLTFILWQYSTRFIKCFIPLRVHPWHQILFVSNLDTDRAPFGDLNSIWLYFYFFLNVSDIEQVWWKMFMISVLFLSELTCPSEICFLLIFFKKWGKIRKRRQKNLNIEPWCLSSLTKMQQ